MIDIPKNITNSSEIEKLCGNMLNEALRIGKN